MQFNNVDSINIAGGDINIKLSTGILIIYGETAFITYVKGDGEIELSHQEMKLVDDMCQRFKEEGLEYDKDENLFVDNILI